MEKVNLELPRAWGSQTTSGHTFHTSESRFLPSPLPSGKDKDGRPLARVRVTVLCLERIAGKTYKAGRCF